MLFEVRALNAKQEIETISVDGKNEREIIDTLTAKGYQVLDVHPIKSRPVAALLKVISKDKISSTDLLNFTRFLSVMLKAGVPLDHSLELILKRAKGDKMKELIVSLQQGIGQGKPMSQSLAKYVDEIGPIYVEMVKVGETGGKLEDALAFLVAYLERARDLKNKVIGSLVYPIVLVVVAVIVAGIFVFFIAPKFADLFAGTDVQIPPTLAVYIFINKVLTAAPILTILGVVLIAGVTVWQKTFLKKFIARLALKTPGIKTIIQNLQVARLSLVLSSLFSAGVPALQALDITEEAMGDTPMAADIAEITKGVTKGEKISATMSKTSKNIPELFMQIVEVGEESATLEDSFEFLAKYYNEETDRQLKTVLTLIEPILLLAVGLGVGILVVSIMLPLYQSIASQ